MNATKRKQIKEVIYDQIKKRTGLYDFSPKDRLDCLGIDSLDQLDLFLTVEQKLKLREENRADIMIVTVQDLMTAIELQMSTPTHTKNTCKRPTQTTTGLFNVKNNTPYCAVTEQPCAKITPYLHNKTDLNLCQGLQCVIARNVYRLMQKTK